MLKVLFLFLFLFFLVVENTWIRIKGNKWKPCSYGKRPHTSPSEVDHASLAGIMKLEEP